jgi:cytochrome c553
MTSHWISGALALLALPATAADIGASNVKAATVCAACHGANGVSVSDDIPNLAGQRADYLKGQLEAFKERSRKSDIMNVIAAQLSAADIASLAAHFASQAAAAPGAKSALLPNIASTHVTLPASFTTGYTRYLTRDSAEDEQVSVYYANDTAFAAAAAGKPLPDGSGIYVEVYSARLGADKKPVKRSDGKLVPDQLQSYVAMARGPGWGDDIPEMLRNENWNYAVFAADRTLRANVNLAKCLACHKPRQGSSFLYLQNELTAAAAHR